MSLGFSLWCFKLPHTIGRHVQILNGLCLLVIWLIKRTLIKCLPVLDDMTMYNTHIVKIEKVPTVNNKTHTLYNVIELCN